MRPQFYDVFSDLYNLYQRSQTLPPDWSSRLQQQGVLLPEVRSLSWITDAIGAAASDLGVSTRLRPDARHFLLINLHQMVVLPLTHPEADGGLSFQAIRDTLRADTYNILQTADAQRNRDGEITGGDVLRAIAQLWPDLRMNQWDVWG